MNPTVADRLWLLVHPRWAGSTRVRRTTAAALAVLALVLAVRGEPKPDARDVVVTTAGVEAGVRLDANTLALKAFPVELIPDGALTDLDDARDQLTATPLGAQEVLTASRVVSPRLAQLARADERAQLVPIHLDDAAVADALRPGDRVDVLASPHDGAGAELVAVDAVVVSAAAPATRGPTASRDRLTLLTLAPDAARAVALAGLGRSLAVTITNG